MSEEPPPTQPAKGGGDPWAAFGYLVAGVGIYGLIGWGLGTWLHASYLIPIGILVGAGLGLLLVYYQIGRPPASDDARTTVNKTKHTGKTDKNTSTPKEPPPGQSSHDRGETE